MIILGIILILLGIFIFHPLFVIGVILLVIGVVLYAAYEIGGPDHRRIGRRYY